MLALKGKGVLAPYSNELKVLMDTVMYIHDVNSKKHPFMSFQKTPEQSDALPVNSLHAIYRHLLAFLADKKEDEYATHMESIACRLWMYTTIYYRHNNPLYNINNHTYVVEATKDSVLDVLDTYNELFYLNIDTVYVHFASEPLISLYKVLNSKDINIEQVDNYITTESMKKRHVFHLQVFQSILHTVLLQERYCDAVTDTDLLEGITLVDLMMYHFLYSFYYYRKCNSK